MVDVLRALDILGLGFTSLAVSPMDDGGDDGVVACTAATTGSVDVTPRRPELLLFGLRGVGVADIIAHGDGDTCGGHGVRRRFFFSWTERVNYYYLPTSKDDHLRTGVRRDRSATRHRTSGGDP